MEPQADRGAGESPVPTPTPMLKLVSPQEPVDAPPPAPVWRRRPRPGVHPPRPHERPQDSGDVPGPP